MSCENKSNKKKLLLIALVSFIVIILVIVMLTIPVIAETNTVFMRDLSKYDKYNKFMIFTSNLNMNGYNITNVGYINTTTIETINFINESRLNVNDSQYYRGEYPLSTVSFINDLNLGWENITDYPASCSTGQAITQINDVPTCNTFLQSISDDWVNITGDTMTGDLIINADLNVSGDLQASMYIPTGGNSSQTFNFYFDTDGYTRTNLNFSTGKLRLISGNGGDTRLVLSGNLTNNKIFRIARVGAGDNELFVVSEAGNDYASYFTRSLVIGGNQSNMTDTYPNLDFRTSVTGADLGIEDDLEVRGSVYINENINVTGNFTGNQIYGGMHFHNDTTGNVTVLTEDVWANVTAFEQEYNGQHLNGFVKDKANTLQPKVSGLYYASYSITFTGNANNKYHVAFGVNNVQKLNTETHVRTGTGADVLSTSGSGHFNLVIDDDVTLQMMNEDSGADATVFSASVNLLRIGD